MVNNDRQDVRPDPTADLRWADFRGGMCFQVLCFRYPLPPASPNTPQAIHDLFSANAKRFPDRVCVEETRGPRTPERVFSYKQIDEASNQLAHYLVANGCERGDVVMVYAHRG